MHDYCYYTCGPCDYPSQVAPAYGGGNTFVLIVVLFILLIIVGACYCK
ncbi:YjcZ family sporulation protein [Sutcliffiella horikoshii]|nr:YjcZ family sporulation protein [Sutcliffiella horikoshii]UAL45630.1 YjcZ family sporulation protein [Sutcliffiella horikoshii]